MMTPLDQDYVTDELSLEVKRLYNEGATKQQILYAIEAITVKYRQHYVDVLRNIGE